MYGIDNGVGFLSNIYKDFATNAGYTYESLWPYIVEGQMHDNMIGRLRRFDHFTRELSRPEAGRSLQAGPSPQPAAGCLLRRRGGLAPTLSAPPATPMAAPAGRS